MQNARPTVLQKGSIKYNFPQVQQKEFLFKAQFFNAYFK